MISMRLRLVEYLEPMDNARRTCELFCEGGGKGMTEVDGAKVTQAQPTDADDDQKWADGMTSSETPTTGPFESFWIWRVKASVLSLAIALLWLVAFALSRSIENHLLEQLTDPILCLGFAPLAGVMLFVVRSFARRYIEKLGPPVGRGTCAVCGESVGVACWRCDTYAFAYRSADRAALLLLRHSRAMFVFAAITAAPGMFALWRDQQRERNQQEQDAAEMRRTVRDQVAATWGHLRGPLISFGAQCGPVVAHGADVPQRCEALFAELVAAYVEISWYLPAYVAELRSACRRRDEGSSKDDEAANHVRANACAALQTAAAGSESTDKETPDYPYEHANSSFRKAVNAYAAYNAVASSAGTAASLGLWNSLGVHLKSLYDDTRKLGCVLTHLDLPGNSEDQKRLSKYCAKYLDPDPGEDKIQQSSNALLSSDPAELQSERNHLSVETDELNFIEWFSGGSRPVGLASKQ